MAHKSIKFFIWLFFGASLLYSAPIRIMPLGDSITYDDTHADHGSSPRPTSKRTAYRSHLWYMLEDANYPADFVGSVIAGEAISPPFDPENEGHPGWDSFEIAEKTYSYMQTSNPDTVLLHIGTNDHASDISGVNTILNEIDRYEKATSKKIKVLVAKIIDRRYADYHIQAFNSNLEDLVYDRILKGDNLVLVDMYREAHLNGSDYLENTHPNSSGYKKMAKVWFNALTTPYTAKLHAYPYSIVNKKYIESITVNESSQNVIFKTQIPDEGIVF